MRYLPFILLSFILSIHSLSRAERFDPDIIITHIDRSIDLSTQIVKESCKLTLFNNGKRQIGYFHWTADPSSKDYLAILGATIEEGKAALKVSYTRIQGYEKFGIWRINFREDLKPGKTITVDIEAFYIHFLTPLPTAITQNQSQLMLFKGNVYFFSPYVVKLQSTTVHAGKHLERYTKSVQHTLTDGRINYGPFDEKQPFSIEELIVHYENNAPFLTITSMERIIEVSHWGNVAVTENISLKHKGATFKGSFSRYDFQRDAQSGKSSVKSFKSILPAAAQDVFYRDDIGNISTSNLRAMADFIEIELRPRFPIFGGWRTKYTIGYNVPSYEYLYYSGNNYVLKMRLLDHVFDDMIVDELTTRFVLPEGVNNVKLKTPYPVERLPDQKHYSYLDTVGRIVLSVRSKNLVELHIQDFELSYTFSRITMFQEPLIASLAIFLLFIIVIVYVRLDLSISNTNN